MTNTNTYSRYAPYLYLSCFSFLDQYAENCTDYFRRDNLFDAATLGSCVNNVVIDPEGPAISTTNPGPTTVTCCKKTASQVCTQVRIKGVVFP